MRHFDPLGSDTIGKALPDLTRNVINPAAILWECGYSRYGGQTVPKGRQVHARPSLSRDATATRRRVRDRCPFSVRSDRVHDRPHQVLPIGGLRRGSCDRSWRGAGVRRHGAPLANDCHPATEASPWPSIRGFLDVAGRRWVLLGMLRCHNPTGVPCHGSGTSM